ALAGPPPNIIEEPAGRIICRREQGPTPVLGRLGELPRDVRVSGPPAERPQRGDRPLGVIEETVEIHWEKVGRLERAQILRVAHPAAREIPAALGSGAHVSIESLAALRSEGLTHLVIRAVRLRPGIGPVVPVPIEDRPSLA